MNISRKEIVLIVLVALLAGGYIVYFTDWFKPKFIRIEHTVRPSPASVAGMPGVSVSFSLHKDYKLTSVQVTPIAGGRPDGSTHPVWHLVSKKGSAPTDGFAYGFPLKGMEPLVPGATPEALQPGIKYRLVVQAGSVKGTNDFMLEQPFGLPR